MTIFWSSGILVVGVEELAAGAEELAAGADEEAAGALLAALLLAALDAAGVPHDANIITAANDVRIILAFFFIKTFPPIFELSLIPKTANRIRTLYSKAKWR
jgi:X-X-X-Leu-X-X-Gly heptad repeat protein